MQTSLARGTRARYVIFKSFGSPSIVLRSPRPRRWPKPPMCSHASRLWLCFFLLLWFHWLYIFLCFARRRQMCLAVESFRLLRMLGCDMFACLFMQVDSLLISFLHTAVGEDFGPKPHCRHRGAGTGKDSLLPCFLAWPLPCFLSLLRPLKRFPGCVARSVSFCFSFVILFTRFSAGLSGRCKRRANGRCRCSEEEHGASKRWKDGAENACGASFSTRDPTRGNSSQSSISIQRIGTTSGTPHP